MLTGRRAARPHQA